MDYLAGALVAFFATVILIPQLARVSGRVGLVDHPSHRKVHVEPIPVCGGVAMACGSAAALVLLGVPLTVFLPYCAGAALLMIVGVLDDIREIGYGWRLGCQALAALIVAWSGTSIGDLPFVGAVPHWLDVAISVLFMVAVTNAVNLLDGLDGLAGGCALLSLLAIGFISLGAGHREVTLLAVVVAAAILAFLHHNTHPAAVFMGDAGSTFLGFTLAVLALMTIGASPGAVSPLVLLPLIGLPLVDTAKVFCERLALGRSPFSADRRHLHHRLLAADLCHRDVVTIFYLMQGAIVFTAALLHRQGSLRLAVFFALAALVVVAGTEMLARTGIVGRLRVNAADRRNLWLRRRRWLPSASRHAVGYAIAAFLVIGAAVPGRVPADLAAVAVVLAALLLLERRFVEAGLEAVFRVAVLGTVILIGYLVLNGPLAASPAAGNAITTFALALVAALAVAMRVTRRDVFAVSPRDVLGGVIAAGTGAAIAAGLVSERFGGPALAIIASLYGCEYLLAVRGPAPTVIRNAAVASLLIVFGRGLLS
jgi:UDP-GlcNAc:undecaprenyl-phosphate GlcNAc-1-phosphate transferase